MTPNVEVEELDYASTAKLWNAIRGRLDRCLPEWLRLIDDFGQVAAVKRREAGHRWSDDEVFEALLRAVLSSHTNWAKVERVLPELRDAFFGFGLRRYADTTDDYINCTLVPLFKKHKAGSISLRRNLMGLRETARILSNWSTAHGSAEHYFLDVIKRSMGDPKGAAVALGKTGSAKKLPALGVPIAAESLRNMGFDVSKPDRHVCRAVGSFGLVRFRTWQDRRGAKPPQASAAEMLATMTIVERIGRLVGERPTLIDNAIWLLCA